MRITPAILLLLAGCFTPTSREVLSALEVIRTDCTGASVVTGATHLRLRVFAGIDVESVATFAVADPLPGQLAVSAGEGRRVVIEAFDADPSAGGKVIAIARSGVRAVNGASPEAWALRLRPVEAFSPVCATMTAARFGHTAVVLKTGEVWIAGGVGMSTSALSSTERFDGFRFAAGTRLGLSNSMVQLPRAFGTATALGNGQVLLWGGEPGAGTPSAVLLVYDPETDAYGAVPARLDPPSLARSRHAAFRVGADVVALGGRTTFGAAEPIERLATSAFATSIDGQLPEPRTEAAIAMLDERTAVVAGGLQNAVLSSRVDLIRFFNPPNVNTAALSIARRGAAAVHVGSGVLIAGGEDAMGAPLGSSEWVDAAATVKTGPLLTPRADACAVRLEDGRALLVGGRVGLIPSAAAELVDGALNLTAVTFPGTARVHATCTLLADGSVLVAGGASTNATALGDAWIFTPRP